MNLTENKPEDEKADKNMSSSEEEESENGFGSTI